MPVEVTARDIKDLRARLGITSVQLAEALGMTSNYLSIVERGIRPFPPKYKPALDRFTENTKNLTHSSYKYSKPVYKPQYFIGMPSAVLEEAMIKKALSKVGGKNG